MELFKANPFKVALIKAKVPEGSLTSAYRVGKLVDLCMGPHLPNSEKLRESKLQRTHPQSGSARTTTTPTESICLSASPARRILMTTS